MDATAMNDGDGDRDRDRDRNVLSILAAVSDAELVRRYEAIRRHPRSPAKDALLREIELRTCRGGMIFDPESHIGYQWQDDDDSVVRVLRSPEAMKAQADEAKRLRYLTLKLGRTALEGRAHTTSMDRAIKL